MNFVQSNVRIASRGQELSIRCNVQTGDLRILKAQGSRTDARRGIPKSNLVVVAACGENDGHVAASVVTVDCVCECECRLLFHECESHVFQLPLILSEPLCDDEVYL